MVIPVLERCLSLRSLSMALNGDGCMEDRANGRTTMTDAIIRYNKLEFSLGRFSSEIFHHLVSYFFCQYIHTLGWFNVKIYSIFFERISSERINGYRLKRQTLARGLNLLFFALTTNRQCSIEVLQQPCVSRSDYKLARKSDHIDAISRQTAAYSVGPESECFKPSIRSVPPSIPSDGRLLAPGSGMGISN